MPISNLNASAMPLPPPPPDWYPPQEPPRRSRKGGALKALVILVVLILLLSILFATPIGKMMLAGLSGNSYAESATFTLNREITIDISSGQINWMCDIPLPVNISNSNGGIQTIHSVAPEPVTAPFVKWGNDWIEWTGSDSGSVTINMAYQATVRTVIWDIDAKNSGKRGDIPASYVTRQGGNEWKIEDSQGQPTGEYKIWPEHPTITGLSNDLTSNSLTVYENVRNVYDYVRNNVEYQTIPGTEPKSCLQTLADGTGDCDDQSILLISLLRAAGIPAWLAFGVLYDQGRDVWGGHAWAEVYMPLVTGTSGSVAIDVVNDEFLVRNCNRLQEWESDGDGEHLSDYYHMLSYNYTTGNPNQPAPLVTLGDSYSGEYRASGRVYGYIDPLGHFGTMSDFNMFGSRKVF
jgi:transglutaminase-like putative cysteine protease